jgi:hypothetical protein
VRLTVTVNVFVVVLPWESLAVHVTVVAPIGKFEPDAGVHVTATGPSTRSFAVGLLYVTVVPAGLVVDTVMFDGTPVMFGGVVSWIVTWNEAVEVFPAASLALHVTVAVPSGNIDPEAGVHEKLVTPTASLAVAV